MVDEKESRGRGVRQEGAGLDIVSFDENFGALKVSPLFHTSDADLDAYLAQHRLPNEWDYFDPA